MRFRGVLMLVFAVLAGLLAIALATRWMQSQAGASHDVQVAVAAVDIPIGSVLAPEMLKLVPWPEESRPEGTFADLKALASRVPLSAIQKGEPVLARRLAPEGSKGGLNAIVSPGKRAITVRVNDVVGVAGFALPGTFVDVLVNTQTSAGADGKQEAISKIVLERILVLAVAQDVERDATKPQVANAVTLEVTPEQAELLDLARSVGSLSLVLRNQTEQASAGTGGVTKDALLGLQQALALRTPAATPSAASEKAAPARPRVDTGGSARDCVEVVRGGVRTRECF